MRTFVIVDLDGTLSDSFYREEVKPDWDAYHAASINDAPLGDMADIIKTLSVDNTIIAMTARPEKWRTVTMAWLLRNEIPISELLMRPMDDWRSVPEVKMALAVSRFGGTEQIRDNVLFIVDDREDVVQAFAGIGVTALLAYSRRGD